MTSAWNGVAEIFGWSADRISPVILDNPENVCCTKQLNDIPNQIKISSSDENPNVFEIISQLENSHPTNIERPDDSRYFTSTESFFSSTHLKENVQPLTTLYTDSCETPLSLPKTDMDVNKCETCSHIIFVIHGIGSNTETVYGYRDELQSNLNTIKQHWFPKHDQHVEVHCINWKRSIIADQLGILSRCQNTFGHHAKRFVALTLMDIVFFMTPTEGDKILAFCVQELNQAVEKYRTEDPAKYKHAKISVVGYSLGGIIAYECIAGRPARSSRYSSGFNDSTASIPCPKLNFEVNCFFALGSPLGGCLAMENRLKSLCNLGLPKSTRFFNIFHAHDPIALRVEGVCYPYLSPLPAPVLLPHWQNRGLRTWHEWDRSVSAVVTKIYSFKSSITDAFSSFWQRDESFETKPTGYSPNSRRFLPIQARRCRSLSSQRHFNNYLGKTASPTNTTSSLPSNACRWRSESKKSYSLSNELKIHTSATSQNSFNTISWFEHPHSDDNGFGMSFDDNTSLKISGPETRVLRRYDFEIQETAAEHYVQPLGILTGHFQYWKMGDVGYFILRNLMKEHETPHELDTMSRLDN